MSNFPRIVIRNFVAATIGVNKAELWPQKKEPTFVRIDAGQTGWPRRVADSSARTRKLFLGEIIHDSCHLVMTCSYSFADSNRVTAICDDLITC